MPIKWTVPSTGHCIQMYRININDKTYFGMAEGDFKKRYNKHTNSFRHKLHSKETLLSKYIWEIKKEYYKMPTLEWSSKICTVIFKYIKKMFIMSSRKASSC